MDSGYQMKVSPRDSRYSGAGDRAACDGAAFFMNKNIARNISLAGVR